MHIVLNVIGLPFTGESLLSGSLGGSETAAIYMAQELAKSGHTVECWTAITEAEECRVNGVDYCSAGPQSPEAPLGARFKFYAQNTPHDVLIIQRSPGAFLDHYQAKVRILWCHDLAVVRNRQTFLSNLAGLDAVFTVSEFHKQQLCEVYQLKREARKKIYPITNGVDLSLYTEETYNKARNHSAISERFNLFYQSRPERGLENLVRPGGIMERLLTERPDAHLFVCGYEHDVPQLDPLYDMCRARIEELPNCSHLGALNKQELAVAQMAADLWVYPTAFEEVSCITAMEMFASQTPGLTCKVGALPETCKSAGVVMLPLLNGEPNIDRFVKTIVEWSDEDTTRAKHKLADAAIRFSWTRAGERFEDAITKVRRDLQKSPVATLNHLRRHSDIVLATEYLEQLEPHERADLGNTPLGNAIIDELENLYQFAQNDVAQASHYNDYYAEHYYGPEWSAESRASGLMHEHPRVMEFARRLQHKLDNDGIFNYVLDYGCFHGHMTLTLAQMFPEIQFTGVDCSPLAIEEARSWQAELGLDNVKFFTVEEFKQNPDNLGRYDALIAAEILEHVIDPAAFFKDMLAPYCDAGAFCYVTTPFGPWEWETFDKYDPYRFHLWHFERGDLERMFSAQENYELSTMPQGFTERGELKGCYLSFFDLSNDELENPTLESKLDSTVPAEPLAVNMIVKDGEATLLKALRSVRWIADEIHIGVDPATTDRTQYVVDAFSKDVPALPVELYEGLDASKDGFAAARNLVLDRTTEGHWVLMIDADEVLIHPEVVSRYLRPGAYCGYAVAQHHYSVEPLGVLDTDYPCRIFKHDGRVRYEGVVHEHPERGDNEGPGPCIQVPHAQLAHTSYTTEATRRAKFNRNIGLMARDREENPDRLLGQFLWIRDLALMCRFELQHTGGGVTPIMRERAQQGVALWERASQSDNPMTSRLVLSGLQFYSTLTSILGGGFDASFTFGSSKEPNPQGFPNLPVQSGHFLSKAHLDRVMGFVVNEGLKDYGSKYY